MYNIDGERNPLVSIVIPVYNRREIVANTVDSALSQTYSNVEIIIVDNRSTDGTYEELLKLYGNNPRISIYQNEKNYGPVCNWRKGIEKSKGKYVKLLFSDDLISETYIEKTVLIIEQDERMAFVISRVRFFNELPHPDVNVKGNKAYRGYHKRYGPIKVRGSVAGYDFGKSGYIDKSSFYKRVFSTSFWGSAPVSPSCALFRKKDIDIRSDFNGSYDQMILETGAGADQYIFLATLNHYSGFGYIDEDLSYFRSHPDSITLKNKEIFRCYEEVCCNYLRNNLKPPNIHYMITYLAKLIESNKGTDNKSITDMIIYYYGKGYLGLISTSRVYACIIVSKIIKGISRTKLMQLLRFIEIG